MAGLPDAHDGDVVAVQVPASTAYVSLLRTVATGVASRLDLPLDTIEDIRLAISEAAALVLEQTETGSAITGEFRVGAGEVVFSLTGTSASPVHPATDSFSWMVLSTLSARLTAEATNRTITVSLAIDRPVHA
jgi:serine/threonine-protein kinase RsbW